MSELNLPDEFREIVIILREYKRLDNMDIDPNFLFKILKALSNAREEKEELANWARGYHQFLEMVLDAETPNDVDIEKVLKKLDPIIDKYRLVLG